MKATIFSDGGARSNPGPAGIGVTIRGEKPLDISEYIGETTNNVAEYQALISGLTEALKLGYTEVEAHCDSELIVRQILGIYKVKQPHLMPLCKQCQELGTKFAKFSIVHVRRELNTEADTLVNQAIDRHKYKLS